MDLEPTFDRLLSTAQEAMRGGRITEAILAATRAVELRPEDAKGLVLLASLEARAGQRTSAIYRLKQVLERDPSNFDALTWLSILCRADGLLRESLEFGRRAVQLRPGDPNVYSNLGLSCFAANEFPEAVACFERAVQLNPKLAVNFEQLGKVRQSQGQETEAFEAFLKAHRLAPRSVETVLSLAQIALNQNRAEEALKFARHALALDPESVTAKLLVSAALIDQGLASAADVKLTGGLGSESGSAYSLLGMQMQALGKMAEADLAFRKSIEVQPDQGISYCSLLRNSRVTEADQPLLEKMEALLRANKLNPRGLGFLHFGLGKAYDDLGRYQRAMEHFDRANEISYRLKFGDRQIDLSRLSSFVDWTIRTFTKEFLARAMEGSSPSNCPIFIVGMMRSGTTLVEQIVSSHPSVEGAGERLFWLSHAHEAIQPGSTRMDPSRLKVLAESYVRELTALFPGGLRITDKMPGNYRVLGVIASAFPNAKMIRTQRDPIDTCLSIYMTPNRIANEFANNRENIVFAYRQYERLAAHWDEVFPPERLMTASYERLVKDPEPTVREMTRFCGLPWDDRCLRPEKNERSVVTPSVWQVRQPVYASSVERWRRYEPWLGAFGTLRTTG